MNYNILYIQFRSWTTCISVANLFLPVILGLIYGIIAAAYLVYFFYVVAKYFNKDDEGDVRLVWLTTLAFAFIIGRLAWFKWLKNIDLSICSCPQSARIRKGYTHLYICLLSGLLSLLSYDDYPLKVADLLDAHGFLHSLEHQYRQQMKSIPILIIMYICHFSIIKCNIFC